MIRLTKALALCAAAALAASYGGGLHPAGDSLSVLRPVLGAATLFLGLALGLRGWWTGRVLALGAAASLAVFAWTRLPLDQPPGEIVVYQKNMLYRGTIGADFAADVRETGADFVTLQEVSAANLDLVDSLTDTYPYRQDCAGVPVGAVVILSRWPLSDPSCAEGGGLVTAVADRDGQEILVAATHASWPWPWSQQRFVRNILKRELSETAGRPVVIGGDFNMVPEGATLRWLAETTGTARIGHAPRTFEIRGYPIAIDHVFATGGQGTVELRPRLGSDHFGVLARIDLPETAAVAALDR